jgi:hypothetical protein
MIDYIELIKCLRDGETLNFGHLQLEAEYNGGLKKYYVRGCRQMEIQYNPQQHIFKLKGSPLYFIQGHNFTWDKQLFIEALKYIESLIGITLFDCVVDKFEYGKIMEIESRVERVISGHFAGNGLSMDERSKDRGNIRYFNDSLVALKLYNAGINIQHKQGLKMKDIIQQTGWNPKGNFIKFEILYKKPHISLNKGKGLRLSNILLPSFEAILNNELVNQYKRLNKMKSIEMPSSKKELYSSDIILLTLAEIALNQGKDTKKLIHAFIKAIPENVLSSEDKKARRKQIKVLLEKVHSSGASEFDISEQLIRIL